MDDNIKRMMELKTAFRRVFNSVDGRLVLAHLASICNISETSFSTDADRTSFNEGRRSVFIDVAKMIDFDNSMYVKLLKRIYSNDDGTDEFGRDDAPGE